MTCWLRVLAPAVGADGLSPARLLYRALHDALAGPLTVVLAGRQREVAAYWGSDPRDAATLRGLLAAAYPEAELVPAGPPGPAPGDAVTRCGWAFADDRSLPLRCEPAPLELLVRALGQVRDGELATVRLRARAAGAAALAPALRLAARAGERPAEADRVAAALAKAAQPCFRAELVTEYAAADAGRAAAAHACLAATLGAYTAAPGNALLARRAWSRRLVLSADELAALAHLPGADRPLPGLVRAGAPSRPPAPQPAGLVLTAAPDPVLLDPRWLAGHAYVIGPSGTGKTALLARWVHELVRTGTGGVVFDPHGDLVRQVLAGLPAEHEARVALFDLLDPQRVPTLNPLWVPPVPDPARSALVRAHRSAAVTAVFADLWQLERAQTPNLLHFLEAALAALLAAQRPLAALPAFLTDTGFRAAVLDDAGDPVLSRRWEQFAALPYIERGRTVRAILNKGADFERNPLLATVFGTSGPGLSLTPFLDGGRVLLVHLPRGLLPEGSGELVGSVLLTLLYQAALAREGRGHGNRPPCVAVVDELTELPRAQLGRMLRGTRKYGLGVVVASQDLAALDADLRAALLGGAATLAAFRLPAGDAEPVAAALGAGVSPAHLQALRAYETYWRLPGPLRPQLVTGRTAPLAGGRDDTAVRELADRLRVAGVAVAVERGEQPGGQWADPLGRPG